MRIEKIPPTPQVLLEFAAEGLQRLGALCERTWHDRLQVVADGPAAAALGRPGELVETELRFPEETQLDPVRDVFPGCPLMFRMAEELWREMPRAFRAALPGIAGKPPPEDVLFRGWARNAGRHPALTQPVKPAWHFTIVALARCEIQAIDQHWSLHQLALAWPGGESDDALAGEIAFLGDEPLPQGLSWPAPEPSVIGALIERHLRQHVDLGPIRKRQERYLGRELARVDAYFLQYRRELEARGVRGGKQARFAERLAAAEEEHLRRRNDQIHRHEISVTPHLDALLWIAEPAWRTHVRWTEGRETREAPWNYVPRLRRWLPPAGADLSNGEFSVTLPVLLLRHSLRLRNGERSRRTFSDRCLSGCSCCWPAGPAAPEIQAIATNRVAIAVASTSKGTAHDKNKKTCSCT